MGESVKPKEKRIFYISALNVVSCMGVVLLHCNGTVWQFDKSYHWIFSWFIETAMYWPVPIFIMITGATLMDYRNKYDTRTYFKKRILKVVIPYIIWSVVSILWAKYYSEYLPADFSLDVRSVVDAIFNINTTVMPVYWFFPVIIVVYCLIPFVSYIPADKRMKAFGYIIGYQMICDVMRYVCYYAKVNYNYAFSNSFGGYIILAMVGWILYTRDFTKKERYIIYVLGIIGWLFRFGIDGRRSWMLERVDSIYSGYYNFNIIMMSSAIFVFFKYIDWTYIQNSLLGKLVIKLSSASFGIYLIHYYVMYDLSEIMNVDTRLIRWIIPGAILVYILSAIVILVMKRIPFIRKAVP
ncbi:MAG: acyltransferase family protein [Lachnospiraceae bacterium]|nr:acyltransferase family protein [Lachnospiraceae bacterium]